MLNIKHALKEIMPNWAWLFLQRSKFASKVFRYSLDDYHRFAQFSAAPWNTDSEGLRAKTIFYVHRIEKGLSHTDFRPGFGHNPLNQLSSCLSTWRKLGYSSDDQAYIAAVDVVKAYVRKHQSMHLEVPSFVKKLFPFIDFYDDNSLLSSGVQTVSGSEKISSRFSDFKTLFSKRCSVREFEDSAVDLAKIMDALDIAKKSPSVCNRQPFRVLIIRENELIDESLEVQGGWRGYPTPPLLLLITVDVRDFVTPEEFAEPYVDGGIYLMSLLLSLEYEGIGACPLNTMFNMSQQKQIRKILHVPANETFIAFVAVGNFREKVLSPISVRYDAKSVLRKI